MSQGIQVIERPDRSCSYCERQLAKAEADAVALGYVSAALGIVGVGLFLYDLWQLIGGSHG